MFPLKFLTQDAVPAALEKAHRYRLLNEPEQAESICEDVLRLQPENQDALATLILAKTDRFHGPRSISPSSVRAVLPRLHGEYERAYFAGIIDEREGIAWMRSDRPRSGAAAYQCFRIAMEHYERAETIRPHGNDDALLRWNSCTRMIANHADIAPAEEGVEVVVDLGD